MTVISNIYHALTPKEAKHLAQRREERRPAEEKGSIRMVLNNRAIALENFRPGPQVEVVAVGPLVTKRFIVIRNDIGAALSKQI